MNFNFDNTNIDRLEAGELYKSLIETALEGEQSKFEFIKSYAMLKAVRLYKRGLKKVQKIFKRLEEATIENYSMLVSSGEFNTIEVIALIKQFTTCVEFYKKEYAVAKDMLSEYRAYMYGGHFLATMLGEQRPDFECVDYRKLPIKFF